MNQVVLDNGLRDYISKDWFHFQQDIQEKRKKIKFLFDFFEASELSSSNTIISNENPTQESDSSDDLELVKNPVKNRPLFKLSAVPKSLGRGGGSGDTSGGGGGGRGSIDEIILFQKPTVASKNLDPDICTYCTKRVLDVNYGGEIQCESCYRWYHLVCLNKTPEYADSPHKYRCNSCRSKRSIH